jgi:hypothetical protein
MAMNKHAEAKLGIIPMVLIILAVAYLFVPSVQTSINGLFGKGSVAPAAPSNQGNAPILTDTKDCPTSGLTTYTITVRDALATTATSLYPEYYVFNGNQLIKEGTLSSTANTVSLSCGKDYKMLLVNTSAGAGNALYAKVVDLKARIAAQSVNEQMVVAGTGKINKVINKLEGASSSAYNNMTLGTIQTKGFQIQFSANQTAKGYNRPIILCQANVTEIQRVDFNSFDDGTKVVAAAQPTRISTTGGYKYWAVEYPKMLDPKQSVVTLDASLTSTATGPVAAATSYMSCIMVDQATWKIANYNAATSIEEGFKTGPENTETNADVGGPDAAAATLYFVNANGI